LGCRQRAAGGRRCGVTASYPNWSSVAASVALRRGSTYKPPPGLGADTDSLLVVTNDDWNRVMGDVGVIPLKPLLDPNSLRPRVCDWPALMALCGHLVTIDPEALGPETRQLSDDEMSRVDGGLAELLGLPFTCQTPPVLPPSPAGKATYPRWGEIFYVGPAVGEVFKRYVVVSNDYWNAAAGSAVVVRTTTQLKRVGRSFPAIEDGAACACCGDATTFIHADFDLTHRPTPARLSLDDMAKVSWGLVETHSLDNALARLGLQSL